LNFYVNFQFESSCNKFFKIQFFFFGGGGRGGWNLVCNFKLAVYPNNEQKSKKTNKKIFFRIFFCFLSFVWLNSISLWQGGSSERSKQGCQIKMKLKIQAALVIYGPSICSIGYSRLKIWYRNLGFAVLSLAYLRFKERFWHKFRINWFKRVITDVTCYSRFWCLRYISET
jgi:hypothetical protein